MAARARRGASQGRGGSVWVGVRRSWSGSSALLVDEPAEDAVTLDAPGGGLGGHACRDL